MHQPVEHGVASPGRHLEGLEGKLGRMWIASDHPTEHPAVAFLFMAYGPVAAKRQRAKP
ncbi:MAG: hypothetical protein ACRDH6_00575 [Actinomycetota bacterium]